MKNLIKKITFLFGLTVLCAACNFKTAPAPLSVTPNYNYSHQLQVGNKILNVEIAASAEAQEKGLSGRESLRDSQGMLFDFGQDTLVTPGFWMPDMKFNLDLVWIANNKIIGITKDVPAPTSSDANLPLYYPPTPVNQVLEVNAGWTGKNKIKIGDEVRLK